MVYKDDPYYVMLELVPVYSGPREDDDLLRYEVRLNGDVFVSVSPKTAFSLTPSVLKQAVRSNRD